MVALEAPRRLAVTHGNSPSQDAADAMIANGWRPMLETLRQVAEEDEAERDGTGSAD